MLPFEPDRVDHVITLREVDHADAWMSPFRALALPGPRYDTRVLRGVCLDPAALLIQSSKRNDGA